MTEFETDPGENEEQKRKPAPSPEPPAHMLEENIRILPDVPETPPGQGIIV